MKSKNALRGLAMAVVLQLGVLAGSAQTNIYLFSGSETIITLPPGTYIITAYGAPAYSINIPGYSFTLTDGGLGAEMSAEFNFSSPTTLTLLVGGGGGEGVYGLNSSSGGGGGTFVVEGNTTPLVIAGGGGGAGNDSGPNGGNGNISTNGGSGLGVESSSGGAGGTNGAGGAGGGAGSNYGTSGGGDYSGGGGGGFLGNGGGGEDINGYGGGSGGMSFENGGSGGSFGYGDAGTGGYGGGGAGGYSAGGGGGGYSGGGGGGLYGSEGVNGGGGGSIIDPSAIKILTEVSGTNSPDDPTNGEIIIIAVPTPLAITTDAAFGITNGVFGFVVTGPSGSNVIIQASTDLQTWIPLQTNLFGSGPLYFSDSQTTDNVRRFYRAKISP